MILLPGQQPLKIEKDTDGIEKQKDREIQIAFKLPVVGIQREVQDAEGHGQGGEEYLLVQVHLISTVLYFRRGEDFFALTNNHSPLQCPYICYFTIRK